MSWLIDLFIILFACLMVLLAYRKGFIRTVISLAGYLVAAILATLLSGWLASWSFDQFVAPSLTNTVATTVEEQLHLDDLDLDQLDGQIDNLYQSLPSVVSGMLEDSGVGREEIKGIVDSTAAAGPQEVAKALVETGVRPVYTLLIRWLTFSLLFAILMVVVNLLSRFLKPVDYIPVLGKLNSVLGGVLGIFKAVFWIYVIAIVAKVFVDLTAGQNSAINDEVIGQTYIFNIFYKYNPLLAFKL